MASVLDLIKHYQHAIDKYTNDEQKILKCINKLFQLDVTVQHLQETGVGRTVNALRKEPGDVGQAARALVYKWKVMVAAEESDQEADHRNDTSNYNGHISERDSEDNTSQSKSRHDQYEKSSKSSKSTDDYKHMNGDSNSHKRRHHSSEEEEPDTKKSKHSSTNDDKYKRKHVKSESSESDTQDTDNSQSDSSESDTSQSSEEDRKPKHKIKEEKQEQEKSRNSSKLTFHGNHKDRKNESALEKRHDTSDKHSRHQSESIKSEKSSSVEKLSSLHKQSSTKDKESISTKKERSSHKSVEKEKKNESSSKHSSSKKESSNKADKHKNSSDKHSSASEKINSMNEKSENTKEKLSSKELLRENHKSRESSNKHSSSTKDLSSKDRSSKDRSSKDRSSKDRSSKDRSSKDRSSKDRSSKDKSSKDDSSKDRSREKHSSSKDHNRKTEKNRSSDSSSKDRKDKHKKESDKSGDDKKKHSHSSSKSSKSSSSKSTEDIPKKKAHVSHSEDSGDDGIDCGSGASFAEALGMISPTKPKKKTVKEFQSPNPFPDLSPASLLAPSAKLAPLPALEISALPEISPNYKPRPPPKLLPHFTDEDAMSHVISSKNQRTKVYSGNKVIGKIPTLYEMCVHVLQEHIDALEYTGGVPYEILKPVVDMASPQQMFMLEHFNPYLMEDTDHLWQKFCEKHFRNKQRQEMETWREMYMRCQEEQEHRLKSLTANIRQTQEAKKAPIKQTKMAYVDTVVKPPRNVLRKQAQHGTAHASTASPAARVASLASGPNVLRGGSVRPPPAAPVSASNFNKPKKAPLMQKALQFMRGRKR